MQKWGGLKCYMKAKSILNYDSTEKFPYWQFRQAELPTIKLHAFTISQVQMRKHLFQMYDLAE